MTAQQKPDVDDLVWAVEAELAWHDGDAKATIAEALLLAVEHAVEYCCHLQPVEVREHSLNAPSSAGLL